MKHIALKIISTIINGQEVKLSYRDQIAEIMRTPADGKTAGIEEMRQSIHILDLIEDTKSDTLVLEDATYAFLSSKILGMRWPFINRDILAFIDEVTKDKEK